MPSGGSAARAKNIISGHSHKASQWLQLDMAHETVDTVLQA